MPGPTFSIHDIPFSYQGSWFNISPVVAEKTIADDLHLVSHQTGMHPVLRFEPRHGDTRASTSIVATPSRLTWQHDSDARRIELIYQNIHTVRVRGTGLGLRVAVVAGTLTPFSGSYLYHDPVSDAHVLTSYETGRRYRITVLNGTLSDATGVEALGATERHLTLSGTSNWEIAIEEYQTGRPPFAAAPSFDETAAAAERRFAAFADAIAPWRDVETPAAELAAYVLWSATVDPAGFITRPGVLMSKHWMDKVWSWDHCFNALALATGVPGLAWDQFQLPFDHQDPTGALPDSVTHSEVLYNFVKPPIHGWALNRLRAEQDLSRPQLEQAYVQLVAWTRFWLDHRRIRGHALPHYQHGNDSGWDNATTFDHSRVIETADLAAFLVLQLRELATLATDLDQPQDARYWQATADTLKDALLRELWQGSRFACRTTNTGRLNTSRSLLDLMPIVLGDELPTDVSTRLATNITDHLTDHGLATEPVASPQYTADGYWRGPIWAPSTVLIEDGLRRTGHLDLADTISRRFRELCEKSGFAENFDAETGTGLRDRAYTWTASSYLILAAAHKRRSVRRGDE